MKYLLSWVIKHLRINNWKQKIDIDDLIMKISNFVAEVSYCKRICYQDLFIGIGTIIECNNDICLAQLNQEERVIHLPPIDNILIGMRYLIIEEETGKYRFANMKDFHADSKNHYIGPIFGNLENQLNFLQNIKNQEDYVFCIDNTSISNRPDLFSHFGLAREIAFLYDIDLIPLEEIIEDQKKLRYCKIQDIFINKSESIQSIFAVDGLFEERESLLEYIFPLCHLDVTPRSFLVDLSNYVMLDLGKPLHIFDKEKIGKVITLNDKIVGNLDCLDNTSIVINKNAVVIASEKELHSLVGIIGGQKSAISKNTKKIIIESITVNKDIISKATKLFGKKTESAIRSEKGIAPVSSSFAVLRFLFLLKKHFNFNIENLQIFMQKESPKIIEIEIDYIVKIIGMFVPIKKIIKILSKLGFLICEIKETPQDVIFIEKPWWREDILNKDDIVEEIARHIGYNYIIPSPPSLTCEGIFYDATIDTIKMQSVLVAKSNEIVTYGIGHEESKKKWQYKSNRLEVVLQNGYGAMQNTLISSAIPSFLDIIYQHIKNGIQKISFFEINPQWRIDSENIIEEKIWTILFYEEKSDYNFFKYKFILNSILEAAHYQLAYSIVKDKYLPHNMYSKLRSNIKCGNHFIGYCGFIDPLILYKEIKKKGAVFAAEINITKLINYRQNEKKIKKYPFFDISFLIDKVIKSEDIVKQLNIAFGNIMDTEIIDWFESNELIDKRSITIRIYILNTYIVDQYNEIKQYLINQGYIIR